MSERYYREPKSRRTGSGIFIFMGVTVIVLCAAVLILAVSLFTRPVIIQSALPEKVEELNLIQFRDQILLVDKSLPLNKYDRDSYSYNGERLNYDDGETKAIFGIDVSSHQEEIDWAKVKADGVEYAMLRVGFRGYTEGGIQKDNRFDEYIAGALENDIKVGIYFFSQALTPEEAREEARWVISEIKDYDITYPVVFDWEFYHGIVEARSNGMDGETLTQCAIAFCEEIEAAGYKPMIYFNMSLGYLYYDLSEVIDYDFWLAELDEPPIFHYNFQMLQYCQTGTVDGIEIEVDLNISYKDYAAAG